MALFARDHILGTVPVADQHEVFEVLADKAVALGIATDNRGVVQDYLEREGEGTTGFGSGIAIPHAKSRYIRSEAVMFVRLEQPVEWHAIDDEPVGTIISILVPAGENATHLKLLSHLSRKLVHDDFLSVLKEGSNEQIFLAINRALSE